jgi:hypothetical protein
MKNKALPSVGLIVSVLLGATPGHSVGEVQISLKNEASIIADECREESDRLVCFKMGGTFEIEKRDVLSIKNISPSRSVTPDTLRPDEAAPGRSDSPVNAGDKAGGALTAGTVSGAASPSDAAAQRRLGLQAEREALLRERQKIQADMKNAPDWMPPNQFNELTRRNAELDARIKRFNEEASRLSEEGKQKQPGADLKK